MFQHLASSGAMALRHGSRHPGRLGSLVLRWSSSSSLSSCRFFASNSSNANNNKKLTLAEMKAQTVARFQDQKPSALNQTWESLWTDGLTGWDLGGPTPALVSELQKSLLYPPASPATFRALVPGCGAGYDLVALAQHLQECHSVDADAGKQSPVPQRNVIVGLDFAPSSLDRAAQVLEQAQTEASVSDASCSTRVDLVLGDFFALDWKTHASFTLGNSAHEQETTDIVAPLLFDFIYDYTFFCALPPNKRPDWGRRTAQLLKPSSGQLLTLMFPILPPGAFDKESSSSSLRLQGPPFPVTVDDYRNVLEPHGLAVLKEPRETPLTVPSRRGMELACWWRR